jgi:glutathione synthase/RimK-type ligase-like ATP-grasp enzyme
VSPLISLGFLTVYEHQEHEYVTEIAKRAERYGIILYRFTPLSIDPLTEKVNGERFDSELQSWVSCVFDIPSFLYDRCFYRSDTRSKQSKPIVQWLKNRPDITFLGYGFPNKWEVYKTILKHSLLSSYIPNTVRLTSTDDLINMLRKEKNIICKPENGSRGKGIYVIQQTKKHLEIKSANGETTLHVHHKQALTTWMNSLVRSNPYICQPLLPLQTTDGKPYDLRFLFQKNENGEWTERGRGVRIGKKGTFVANISAGATIFPFPEWMNQFSKQQNVLINDSIETILNALPRYLEQQFGPLFEFGLDIGITGDGAVWILDINSKPGRKIVMETTPHEHETLYHAPLRYCQFLSKEVNVS